ncbi:g8869 [Coccomyxa viridis]|uniref:G8869 protein n=1 Tax=Coccomyxa viridis TaxID=1274662 RepID=A0ABP1G1H0_9CHLO
MGPQARAGDADAVPAQPQPQPQLAISPHLVGAWSAGVIDPRSWGFGSESMSSGRGPAACARCDAPLQACQTRSAPCGQPSGQQRTVMSTAASVALSLVGQQHGIIASSSSPRQVPRVLLASEEHQTHPLTLRGCIALSLVQLLFDHRSRSLRHQLSQQSLHRDSACVPPCAAMIPTLLLWQRHILPALTGHTAALDRP